jgi:NAD-dependent dihydropyrimidine dehydrogenase PreA subunit
MPTPSSCDRLTLRVVLFKVSPLVGRIYLMKMAARRQLRPSTKHGWAIFDTCLGCMACMTACPSGVDYAKLVEATRAQIERRFTRPAPEKRFRRFLFSIFTRPARLRALLLPVSEGRARGAGAAHGHPETAFRNSCGPWRKSLPHLSSWAP